MCFVWRPAPARRRAAEEERWFYDDGKRKNTASAGGQGADCALFLDEVSIRWLTRFAASDGAAVVDRTGVRLLVDPRYYAAAKDAKAAGRLFDDVCPEPFSGGLLAALASLSAGGCCWIPRG